MKNLKGTQTEANLLAAFMGESMARNKYSFFAKKAKADGFEQISEIFDITAQNEMKHAYIWYTQLHGALGDTLANLEEAMQGENSEWTQMYASFAETARQEGFENIARLFDSVGKIEAAHEERFGVLADNLKNNEVFAKTEPVVWICRNCGHIHYGMSAPEKCPVCSHPQSYFELKAENY